MVMVMVGMFCVWHDGYCSVVMSGHVSCICVMSPCPLLMLMSSVYRRWPMLMPSGTWQSPWAREMLSRTSRKNPGKSYIHSTSSWSKCVFFLRRDKYKAFMERCVEGDTAESYIVQAIFWGHKDERSLDTIPRLRQRSREAPTSPRLWFTWIRQSSLVRTRWLWTPGAGIKLLMSWWHY